MFYDLEDPIKFAEDVYELLDKDGIWHLELSYMPLMIKNLSYDTICHEHLEYYSLNSIKYIFDKVGFSIIDIQLNDINGGSFALTLSKNKNSNNKVVEWLLNQESKDNINNISTFKKFFLKISKQKKDLKNLLENLIDMKKKVYGYGASTKGNVILQFSNINSKLLPLIGEVNPFKFNRYTPGTKIKIVSEAVIKKNKPDYLLVLPWHFKEEFLDREREYLDRGGQFIFPLPYIDIISNYKKVLITGISGNIGTYLKNLLLDNNNVIVYGIVNNTIPTIVNTFSNVGLIPLSYDVDKVSQTEVFNMSANNTDIYGTYY